MSKHLQWRAAVVLVVIGVCSALGVYPLLASRLHLTSPQWLLQHRLKLGLDLQGGVHLVLGVNMPAGATPPQRDDAVSQTIDTIERRVNELGVTEPVVARQGTAGEQILVQLPGVTNIARAKALIQSTGVLELSIVAQGPASAAGDLMIEGRLPPEMNVVPGDNPSTGRDVFYLVPRQSTVTGRDLRMARASLDDNNRPAVSFTLSADAGRRFGDLTGGNLGRTLAVILDGRVQSTARIETRITTDGRILGTFTPQQARDLAVVLRSGSLPVPLTYLEEQTIGPSLGTDAIRAGVRATVTGLVLIVVFLLVYYGAWGMNASIALLCNLIILLGLLASMGVVMTLPGIAGLVLTMGIGVDSSVLIFERIKEERATGRSLGAAVDAGFRRVFLTLLDTHVAALISAACLFQFGTGPIRGFAVTLALGLISNLFTSTLVSRTLFDLARLRRGRRASASHSTDAEIARRTA
jgi:preprotein translocase subunit SecD